MPRGRILVAGGGDPRTATAGKLRISNATLATSGSAGASSPIKTPGALPQKPSARASRLPDAPRLYSSTSSLPIRARNARLAGSNMGRSWKPAKIATKSMQVCGPDDLGPFLGFGRHERPEVFAEGRARFRPKLANARDHVRRLEHAR